MASYLVYAAPLVIVVLYCCLSSIRTYWRLRHFKGPKIAAWTDWWYVKLSNTGEAHILLGETVDKYGNMCRVGTNLLLTDDGEFVRKMNAVRSEYAKGDWYKALKMDGNFENIISETDHAGHMQLRNKLVNGYAGTGNPHFEGDIDSVIRNVIELIESKYVSHGTDLRPFDHSAVMQYMTLDVVTKLSLGEAFGWVTQDKDVHEYLETMWVNFPVMNFMLSYPPIVKFMSLPVVQKLMVPSMKDKTGLGKIKGVAFDRVSERFNEKQSEKGVRQDMMDSFIKHGLSEQQIADNTLAQLLAGSDTTVAVLRASFVLIISNARVYKRLQAECDEFAKTVPFSDVISFQQAQQLPYLDACVKESLRYHPAATGLLPRVVPAGGDYYEGRYIPPGTVVGVALWNMSRKNKAYGNDCEVFRPERWLESSPEQLEEMERAQELLFMTGRHRCLGERIAKMELYKVIFEMLRRFEVASLTPLKPIEKSINYGIWMQRGMWLRLEARETAKEKT